MKSVPVTFRRNGKYVYRFFCAVALTAIATYLFYTEWHEFIFTSVANSAPDIMSRLLGKGNLGMSIGLYMLMYMMIGKWLSAFTIGVERKSNILAGQVLTLITVDVLEVMVSCAVVNQFRYYLTFIKLYSKLCLMQMVILCIIANFMVDIYRKAFPPLKVVEIYGDNRDDLWYKVNSVRFKYDVVESISIHEGEEVIREALSKYDAALIDDITAHDRNRLIKVCFDMNKRVYYVPKISDVLVKNSQELNLIDAPLFLNKNNGIGPLRRFVKRAFDLVLSFISIIVFSPLMLVTAIAIKIEDGGPVFFKQERVTRGGKHFMILKFRSMIVDAEKDGKPHPAGEADDRITRVGRVIRATRIDEIPQLFNILFGDMSIVGPRPERWEHVEQYSREIPEFVFRLKVKGGLTGYAQVYGKYNTTALDKLKLDLLYITNYSFLLDLQIIFQTLKILFVKESTEGFSEADSKKLHDAKLEGDTKLLKM